VAHHIHT